ncbi:MAG: hypothetical protein RR400_03785, partial [Clostridia bacterium]
LDEVYEAADLVKEVLDPDCNIIFGSGIDEAMNDEVEITIIATGFPGSGAILEDKNLQKMKENVQAFNGFSSERFDNYVNANSSIKQAQAPADKPQIADIFATQAQSSRLKIDDSEIPPFLRKLRKDKF